MILPKNSIKYLLLQRTSYLKNNQLAKILNAVPFYQLSVGLKARLLTSPIRQEFNQDMLDEFSSLKPFLPAAANSILDIGCGLAGIDVLISQHYQNQIEIFLLDKTSTDKKIYYHFNQKGSFYNSLPLAKKILEINGVDSNKIHLQEATDDNKIEFPGTFDIIISLISWGYHYPAATYLEPAYQKLNPGGALILDIRKNTGGEKEIAEKFGSYQVISKTEKSIRILANK